jgi:hypothetical protein
LDHFWWIDFLAGDGDIEIGSEARTATQDNEHTIILDLCFVALESAGCGLRYRRLRKLDL